MKLKVDSETTDVFDVKIHNVEDWFYMEKPKNDWSAVFYLLPAAGMIALIFIHVALW